MTNRLAPCSIHHGRPHRVNGKDREPINCNHCSGPVGDPCCWCGTPLPVVTK